MLTLTSSHNYYLYKEEVDMRKGFNSLSGLVTNKLGQNPLSGDVYIFLNKNKTHIKLLRWEQDGFVLYYKRLEKGNFELPSIDNKYNTTTNTNHLNIDINYSQLVMMIQGIKMNKIAYKKRFRYNL